MARSGVFGEVLGRGMCTRESGVSAHRRWNLGALGRYVVSDDIGNVFSSICSGRLLPFQKVFMPQG